MMRYWWQGFGDFAPTPENYPNPAEVLKQYRRHLGKTVEEVANELQRSRDRVYCMESTGKGLNSVRHCQILSFYLSIPPELFGIDSLYRGRCEWWIAEGYPSFASGCDGYPLPGEVIKYYRRKKWQDASPETRPEWDRVGLAAALSISESALGKMEKSKYVDTIERRRTLSFLLGIPPALLGLDSLVHLSPVSTKTVSLSIKGEYHKQQLAHLWGGYYREHGQNTQEVALKHIAQLGELPSTHQEKELTTIIITYQAYLAETFREQAASSLAISHLSLALKRGEEMGNKEAVAMLLLRRSAAYRESGDYPSAFSDIERAQQLIPYAYTGLQQEIIGSAGYMTAIIAQDASDVTRSLRLFDQAGSIARQGVVEEDPYFLNANQGYYHLRRAKAYLALGGRKTNFLDAQNEIDLARKLTPVQFSRRHIINDFTQAQVYLRSGEYPEATTLALDTLPKFKAIKSTINLRRFAGLYQSLLQSSYGTSPFVGRLGYELSTMSLF